MNITLYNTSSLSNTVNKTLTNSQTISGASLLDNYKEYAPTVRLAVDPGAHNYMLLDGKYYYIEDVDHKSNSIFYVYARLDVLMTYQAQIRAMTGWISRGADSTPYLVDDSEPLANYNIAESINFSRGFDESENAGCYVILTSQKGYSD